MSRRRDGTPRERRSLREILAAPAARKVLRIIGWTLTGLAAVWLIGLITVVLTQPADRAFTRPEEWIGIALLSAPAILVLLIALIRLILRHRKG